MSILRKASLVLLTGVLGYNAITAPITARTGLTEARNQGDLGQFLVVGTCYRRAFESMMKKELRLPHQHCSSPGQYAFNSEESIDLKTGFRYFMYNNLATLVSPVFPWDSFYNPDGTSFRSPGYREKKIDWHNGIEAKVKAHYFWNQFHK